MIKSILYDLDGVVVDSEPLYQKAEDRLFAAHGVTIPEEDWILFTGSTEQHFYMLARERYGISVPVEELRMEGRREVLAEFDKALEFREGFMQLHAWTRRQFSLGLVTSTPEAIYEHMDARLNLDELFDKVLTGNMTAKNKPDPEPYQVMMEQLKVRPKESVIIEDSSHGLVSAWAAGGWTIAVTGSVTEAEMPERHATVRHLDEITPDLIRSITASELGELARI